MPTPPSVPPRLSFVVDWLTTGYHVWDGSGPASWASGVPVRYAFSEGWSAAQRDAAVKAMALWSDLANITFAPADDLASATLTFVTNTSGGAFENDHRLDGRILAAQISFDTASAGYGDLSTPGGEGFKALVHELGHAIGLGHGGAYNAGLDVGSGKIFTGDTLQHTVMSYFAADNGIHGDARPWTPMLADILAIQNLYGANEATRTGNTTYGFNGTAGGAFLFTADAKPVLAIHDAGGTDTLDLSGFGQDARVDLQAGSYNDAAGLKGNIAIAFDTWIEKAITGAGNDTLSGNDLRNRLSAGAGNDSLVAGDGISIFHGGALPRLPDTLIGGAGDDTLLAATYYTGASDSLNGGTGNDLYIADASDLIVDASGADTVTAFDDLTLPLGIEVLEMQNSFVGKGNALDNLIVMGLPSNATMHGLAGRDTLLGHRGSDELLGGSGSDSLSGGDGHDWLDGGTAADTMAGGAGDDVYVLRSARQVIIEAPGQGFDAVVSHVAHTLGDTVEDLVLDGQADLAGTGNGADNIMVGNVGRNLLRGLDGADTLDGWRGDDTIIGGLGADSLAGAGGNDTFRYVSAAEGGDVIRRFAGAEDTIEVSAAGFGGGLVAGATLAGSVHHVANDTGQASSAAGVGQFVMDRETGTLWWDADGAGGADAQLLLRVTTLVDWSGEEIRVIA